MEEIERWLAAHDAELDDLAARVGADDTAVKVVAAFVLAGATDDQVYDVLREATPVWNGQENPLDEAPRLLAELRALADTS